MQLWQELSLAQCERLLNQALAHDLSWQTHAKPLHAQRILFHLQTVDYFVLAQCSEHWVSLSFETADTPSDLTITATPKACMQALRDKALPRSIKISGDALLAQALQEAMFNSHIDWEGLLSSHVGDVPARTIHQGIKKAAGFLARMKKDFMADAHDYLIDESALVVSSQDLQHFIDEVNELRYATDRLEARLHAIQTKELAC